MFKQLDKIYKDLNNGEKGDKMFQILILGILIFIVSFSVMISNVFVFIKSFDDYKIETSFKTFSISAKYCIYSLILICLSILLL